MKIVYVGRLMHSKGVVDLLAALKLIDRHDVECVIVGDGPQRRQLEQRAVGGVGFVGEKSLPDVIKILKNSDIFVSPSYTEGLPTAVIEAALCGKAIIATNIGGTPELVTHEKSALLIPPHNVAALAAALQRLIADSALRERFGQAAYEQNKNRWSWERSGEKYESLFNGLFPQNHPAPRVPLLRKEGQLQPHYLWRLDDICPTMDWENFERLKNIFLEYNVKPVLGIVPDNRDSKLVVDPPQENFWPQMRELANKGWVIAQHGYQHRYVTYNSGLLKLRARSEFAGLPYREQYQKISAGRKILQEKLGQKITWWMAPAHSFDTMTCQVLGALGFTHITDGIALYPFEKYGLIWVPHQMWKPEAKLFGMWTIALHLNSLQAAQIRGIEQFIKNHRAQCKNLDFTPRESVLNIPYRWYWYLRFDVLRLLARALL